MHQTIYARINLEKTNYTFKVDARVLQNPQPDKLLQIYDDYCKHKKFASAWPYYPEQFLSNHHDVIGYFDNHKLVAWTLVYKINKDIAESLQFAWNYTNPKLHLGINSLRTECAMYKAWGYKYYLLGEAHDYKKQIDGYEVIGPR